MTHEERIALLNDKILKLQREKSAAEKKKAESERRRRAHTLIQLAAKTYGENWDRASQIILNPDAQIEVFVNHKKLSEYL